MAQLNTFLTYINLDAMREYCMAHGEIVHYAKGDCFIEAEQIGRYVGFVKSGYFKYCVLTSKGDYAVTGFTFKDECVTDVTQSFLFDKPSKVSIMAGCDAEVLQVPLRPLRDYLSKSHPGLIQQIAAVCLEEAYTRYLRFYQKTPTERYLELVEKYPEFIEQVTLRDIASYLLVTPVYLSRIRKKLGK
ncbi:MAG: Crp/Fnr family transcriptional regulator [Muribaculaceae bacterium]|nr:Crp/Fnr family transcriptional regulator [Muribaculaceae bacterium]